jgi:hypothetical protein
VVSLDIIALLLHTPLHRMLAAGAPPDIVLLFAGSGLVLYVASRAGVDALTPTADPAPGKMAFAQWLPIAWLALLASLRGHSEVGFGVAMATSVAALALNLGVLVLMAPGANPEGEVAIAPAGAAPAARAWPFVVPAALLAFLAGFTGFLNFFHALMLLLLGACVLAVWRVRPPDDAIPIARSAHRRRIRPIQLVLAIALGGVGAWLALQAILVADAKTRVATSGLIAAAVMSPLLVLPMLGAGAIAVQNGRMSSVIASLVGVALLNVCCLLPLIVVCDYAHSAYVAWHGGMHDWRTLLAQLKPTAYPLAVWRVDTILLVVLGLLLVPVSLGRWTLKKAEGLCLALGYVAYLLVSAALAVRL